MRPKVYLKPGMKIGRLVLLRRLSLRYSDIYPRWECVCECGERCVKSRNSLRLSKTFRTQHECPSCKVKTARAYALLRRAFGET